MAQNFFVKQLREMKGWDLATIYYRSMPPFNIDRKCQFRVEENEYLVIPANNNMRLDDGKGMPRYGMLLNVILNVDEIIRIDFIQELPSPIPTDMPPFLTPEEVSSGLVNVHGASLEK